MKSRQWQEAQMDEEDKAWDMGVEAPPCFSYKVLLQRNVPVTLRNSEKLKSMQDAVEFFLQEHHADKVWGIISLTF